MRNYKLGFISDNDIYEHVKCTVESYRRNITLEEFNVNIVDPIKLTFDSKVYGKTIEQVIGLFPMKALMLRILVCIFMLK